MTYPGATGYRWLLQVDEQAEVGPETYDLGARILTDFFRRKLAPYLKYHELDPMGREIINLALTGGSVAEYEAAMPAA